MKRFLERPLKIGTIIQSRYKILSFVGKGSYGMVYLAFDKNNNKKVIIKQDRVRVGKNCKKMLKDEAHTLSLLSHESIPKCLNFFRDDYKSFLVMDYIEGKNFEDLVLNEGSKFNEKESLQILLKVLNIVKYIHKKKVIHRDLRLPNIIWKNNQVYIIDFGLSVFSSLEEVATTKNIFVEKDFSRDRTYTSDFYALGHFVLFLLYSNFETSSNKEESWEEELMINNETKMIIKRLLRLEKNYQNIDEIIKDVVMVIQDL